MPAYIIVEIDVLDAVGYEEYKKLAGSTVEKYGGKYIVRGGKTEVLEGDGNRSASLCFNLNQPSAPKSGSTAKNIGNRAKCDTARPEQT